MSVNRSGVYHHPAPEGPRNLSLMRLIDEQFLETPYYRAWQMARHLWRLGHGVGRKRIGWLMCRMGLTAIYQKPRTSVPHPQHPTHPDLLKGLVIDRPHQVWCLDITYIPMSQGILYRTAIMDWATRKVLAWRLSNTMDADFCLQASDEALALYGAPQEYSTPVRAANTSARVLPTC